MKIKNKSRMTRGGRNLVILGVVSTVIAMVTTCLSLLIYHNSGDIYLDRSRPGFLPDEEEIKESEIEEEDYSFEKSGKLTAEILVEYLEKLNVEVKAIDSYGKPFSEDALSDENLGMSGIDTEVLDTEDEES